MAIKWLTTTVQQGSADAFAEGELQTGLSNITGSCWRVRRIEFYVAALASADSDITVQLSGKSLAAVNVLANSCIAAVYRKVELTTSGSPVYEIWPNAQVYDRDYELLIVEESVYLTVDSSSTGAQNVAGVKIWVESRSITQTERLTIQASRLA